MYYSILFYIANKCLLEIAHIINRTDSEIEIEGWIKIQKSGFDKFFKECDPFQQVYHYYVYDLIRHERIRKATSSCIFSIFGAGLIDSKEATKIVMLMRQKHFGTGRRIAKLVPSYAVNG